MKNLKRINGFEVVRRKRLPAFRLAGFVEKLSIKVFLLAMTVEEVSFHRIE
jgi:hypothetical protein